MGIGKARIRTFLALLFSLAGLILIYLSLRPVLTPVADGEPLKKGATFLDGRYEGWEGTKQSWILEAAEIFRTPDGQKVTFQGIRKICFFQEDGSDLVFQAGAATLDLKRNILTLDEVGGEVGGGELRTERMELDLEKKLVKCFPPLSFSKERLKVQAAQMEGDFEKGEYCFFGDLVVVQKGDRIWGETFIYKANEDRFEIRGAVEVELVR